MILARSCSMPSKASVMPFNSFVTCRWWPSAAGASSSNVSRNYSACSGHQPGPTPSWPEASRCRPLMFTVRYSACRTSSARHPAVNVPSEVPYLFPYPDLLQSWGERLNATTGGFKVAIAWAGNPTLRGDRTRSISLDRLAPLAHVPGVTFYSIQKGDVASQADKPCGGNAINRPFTQSTRFCGHGGSYVAHGSGP